MSTKGAHLGLADDILKTRQAELRELAQRQAPTPYKPRIWRHENGEATIATGVYDSSFEFSEAQLLRDHGYDPETHMIADGWGESTWTAYKPKEYRRLSEDGDVDEDLDAFTFTAKAFKFHVKKRPQGQYASDVEDVVLALDKKQPAAPAVSRTSNAADAWILAIGDTQIGKLENPLEELSQRFTDMIDHVVHSGPAAPHIHIGWLGDCIEGTNSQKGALRWRTTLTLTEQVRVLQRYMMYAIEALAPYTDRLTVSSVPGNHDEAHGRDLQTRMDDSWAIQALVSVEDALNFSQRQDLKHVECYVPAPDGQDVTMEVGGVRVAQIHGHQFRVGKEYDWWRRQMFHETPAGTADLLLHGHQHHWTLEEQGRRLRIGVPAMETKSIWWEQKMGAPGNPGSLLLSLKDERIRTLERLS